MPHHYTRKKNRPIKPKIPPVKHTISSGHDFYMHVNGNWLQHTTIPSYLSSYGVSEEVEEIINNELLTIVTDARTALRNNPTGISHTNYLIGSLAESVLNPSLQQLNVKHVKSMVSSFKCMRDTSDIGRTIGDLIKHRTPTILSTAVEPMETESKILRLILFPGTVGLPDSSYYSQYKSRTLAAYTKLLKQLAVEFDMEGLEQIVGIEKLIIETKDKTGNEDEVLLRGRELKDKFPLVPWDELFEASIGWSPSEVDSHEIVITSMNYIKNLNKWFRIFPIDIWKLLLASQLILYTIPLLPPPFDNWYFELFKHRMRGQNKKMPKDKLALHLSKHWLGASLGSLFIGKYVSKAIKQQAKSIALEIRDSAITIVSSTEWLDESTRQKAMNKIRSIYFGVAYPSVIKKDKYTELHPEQMIKNILLLSELDFKDEMKKLNTELHPDEWEDDVFAVNAYYYNEGNRLILPAGTLRWPFFDITASHGWNFGGLGCAIGHEISHAFDEDGKDFDEHGNKNIWWSRGEQAKYHKKTKALIELYNKTTHSGQHVNGVLTLSENIADLCGVSIALGALKKRLKNVPPHIAKKELCDFFTSYAVSWRTKEKKEKVAQSLIIDVHAPPSVRVNNIVCQFQEWYECFDIQPGDHLYKDPTERIRIF